MLCINDTGIILPPPGAVPPIWNIGQVVNPNGDPIDEDIPGVHGKWRVVKHTLDIDVIEPPIGVNDDHPDKMDVDVKVTVRQEEEDENGNTRSRRTNDSSDLKFSSDFGLFDYSGNLRLWLLLLVSRNLGGVTFDTNGHITLDGTGPATLDQESIDRDLSLNDDRFRPDKHNVPGEINVIMPGYVGEYINPYWDIPEILHEISRLSAQLVYTLAIDDMALRSLAQQRNKAINEKIKKLRERSKEIQRSHGTHSTSSSNSSSSTSSSSGGHSPSNTRVYTYSGSVTTTPFDPGTSQNKSNSTANKGSYYSTGAYTSRR